MTARKSVTIHYRKFQRPAGVTHSLEHLLRSALNTCDASLGLDVRIKDRYVSRLQTVGSDNLFINLCIDQAQGTSYVMGDLLHFTKGRLQALFKTADPEAALVPVQQMQAPAQSEYVHSQMFWLVKGDHVFVIQSISLQTDQLEAYWGWLLSTKTQVVPTDARIVLAAKFDVDAVGGDLDDIQQIIVGGIAPRAVRKTEEGALAHSHAHPSAEKSRELTGHGSVHTTRTAKWSTARAVLSQLLDGDANVDRLLNAVPQDVELNVQVHIGFATKKRKVDRVALRELETGLRNLPDGQLEVVAKGKKMASDGSIRLHHKASVKLIKSAEADSQIISALLDPADVQRALIEAYDYFVNNGKIK